MKDTLYTEGLVYLDGLGWVKEITIIRLNEDGIPEPYTTYEMIKPL